MISPKVSVIIPCFNAEKTLTQVLEAVLAQSYSNIELVAVDDGSEDATFSLLKGFEGRIKILRKRRGGPASARNFGVKQSSGEFVAFTDSDCVPQPDWVDRLIAGFSGSGVAGVGGSVKSAEVCRLGEYIDMTGILNPATNTEGEVLWIITANAAFRRDVLMETGLFDERFRKPGGEEPELCMRIRQRGYRLEHRKDAVVYHHHRQTVISLLKTTANYGEGRYVSEMIGCRENPSSSGKCYVKLLKFIRGLGHKARYTVRYGLAKGLFFAVLDYCRHIAFRAGYLRCRKELGASGSTGKDGM